MVPRGPRRVCLAPRSPASVPSAAAGLGATTEKDFGWGLKILFEVGAGALGADDPADADPLAPGPVDLPAGLVVPNLRQPRRVAASLLEGGGAAKLGEFLGARESYFVFSIRVGEKGHNLADVQAWDHQYHKKVH